MEDITTERQTPVPLRRRPSSVSSYQNLEHDRIRPAVSPEEFCNKHTDENLTLVTGDAPIQPHPDQASKEDEKMARSAIKVVPRISNPWGLVIILAGFLIQTIVLGILGAFGLYTAEFLKYYDTSATAVSAIDAIHSFFLFVTGPFVSIMVKRFGHRAVVISGGVLSTAGLLSMMFAENVETLYVLFGVITGLGFCMSYLPSHVLAGLYYDKYQSLATGVVTSGGGFGATVMPLVTNFLIEEYSWKGSILVLSGMCFHIVLLGALLRPLPQSIDGENISLEISDETECSKLLKPPRENLKDCSENFGEREKLLNSNLSAKRDGDKIEGESLIDQRKVTPKIIEQETGVDSQYHDSKKKNSNRIDGLKIFLKQQFHVFSYFGFVIYFINNIFWNFTFESFFTLAPIFFMTQGLSESDAALLLTITHFGSFVGSIVGAVVGNIKFFNRMRLYIVANIVAGICAVIYNFIHTLIGFGINSLIFGFSLGVILGLLVILLIDILDTDLLSDGMGYLMISNGIGCLVGPPLAGYLFDIFLDFQMVFYMFAASVCIGGLIMFSIPLQERCVENNKKCGKKSIERRTS